MESENKIGLANNATEQQTGGSGQKVQPEVAKQVETSRPVSFVPPTYTELIDRRRIKRNSSFVR